MPTTTTFVGRSRKRSSPPWWSSSSIPGNRPPARGECRALVSLHRRPRCPLFPGEYREDGGEPSICSSRHHARRLCGSEPDCPLRGRSRLCAAGRISRGGSPVPADAVDGVQESPSRRRDPPAVWGAMIARDLRASRMRGSVAGGRSCLRRARVPRRSKAIRRFHAEGGAHLGPRLNEERRFKDWKAYLDACQERFGADHLREVSER